MLALTAGLAGCANMPAGQRPGMAAMSAPSDETTVAALDPLNAPPPPMTSSASAATAPSDPLLLVPAPSDASQRVPLGTLGQTPTPPQAAKPPTPLAPRDAAVKVAPPAPSAAQSAPASSQRVASATEFTPAPVAPAPAAPVAAAPATPTAAAPPPAKSITLNVQPGAGNHATPRGVPATGPDIRPVPTVESASTMTAPAPATRKPSTFEEETTIISSTTAAPALQGREFVPAPVVPVAAPPAPPALGEMPFSQAEKNIAKRFETLARLRDEALITQDEFNRRRSANLGALLPYSQQPPGVGLDRSVPSSEAIVARLGALRRSFEMRAITAQQHALERTMILNALLPESPEQRTGRKPPPEDVIQGAAMVGHLEALREEGIITQSELDAERKMVDAVLRTGLFPPKGGDGPAPSAPAKTAAKPAAPPPPTAGAAGSGAENPMETVITGPVLHLASFRSEASARQGWQQVLESNKAALANLKPIIRRVDLGEGRGIFYRLMTGSFTSMAEAETACVKLKQNNQFCRASADGS